jgi:hypothetical protein
MLVLFDGGMVRFGIEFSVCVYVCVHMHVNVFVSFTESGFWKGMYVIVDTMTHGLFIADHVHRTHAYNPKDNIRIQTRYQITVYAYIYVCMYVRIHSIIP